MLPGGMMPIVQLIAIVRSVPPRRAAELLSVVPLDRLGPVLEGIGPAGIARLLSVATREFRATLFDALTESQLDDVMRTQPEAESTQLLTWLPDDRLSTVVGTMRDVKVARLLSVLPDTRQDTLLQAMDPARRYATLSRLYEQEIGEALLRSNVEVTIPADEPAGVMLAHGLGRRIVVAARYNDDGTAAVHDAEAGAYRLRANAALSVTDLGPSEAVVSYCRESRLQGRALDAVIWTGNKHDSLLTRTLVSLFHP